MSSSTTTSSSTTSPTTTTTTTTNNKRTKLVDQEQEEDNKEQSMEKIPHQWKTHITKILFSEKQIQQRISELAQEINVHYHGKENIIVVCMLKGALMFMTDLVRQLRIPNIIDFMTVSSYRGTQTTGTVQLKQDLSIDPAGKHLLIVEDIIDTGTTLAWLREFLESKNCASIKIACLLDKKIARHKDSKAIVDFIGFTCPDEFVVGYGMDYKQLYRGLPFIGVLGKEGIDA
jgi:hypoxanthine phosphoribosyltransferase